MKLSIITSFYQQMHLIPKTKEWLGKQTFKDFEWIVGIDEDNEEAFQWATKNADKYVWQPNIGYRYGQIINKAAEVAEGEYLVWINADSYPKEDFLEEMAKALKPERLVNGIRMNVNHDGQITSPDWRLAVYGDEGEDVMRVMLPDPWKAMTLNSMGMNRALFNKIGGMCDEYVGYGKEDWDLCMRAYFDGAEFWWATKAVLYTEDHPPKQEVPQNTVIFNRRLQEYAAKDKTVEKIKIIMDPARAQMKMNQQIHHMHELERAQQKEL